MAVSIGAVITLASKFGNRAMEMNLDGAARVVVADLFYFAANCLTFAGRFVIFHFILFADRNAKVDTLEVVEGRAPVTDESVEPLLTTDHHHHHRAGHQADQAPFADTMGSAGANGMSAWANGSAGQHASPAHDEADGTVAPEHGSRR